MYKNNVIKNLIEKIKKVTSFVLENIAMITAAGLGIAYAGLSFGSVFYIGGSSAVFECLGYIAVEVICLFIFWGVFKLDNETPIDTIIRKFNLLSDLSS
jgi:hypothetical protein